MKFRSVFTCLLLAVALLPSVALGEAEKTFTNTQREAIDAAVRAVNPALVRIHVVETYYRDGREGKYEASGSGAVITEEGHVITNHHVAGHAKQIKCVFPNKEEIEAVRVGTDALTDIAVLKLKAEPERKFKTVTFGDSSAVQVGDYVLAMGSPLALSQSVTLGIVSNTEMMMPSWISRSGGLEMDGEDVGSLVRWLGHDAVIFGGNSGGPLVDINGRVIGINEIKMGLGGAIPGNLALSVARELMEHGDVTRSWIGVNVQPRLRHSKSTRGILVGGVFPGGPAEEAGIAAGDLIVSIGGEPVDVEFEVQLPDFNLLTSELTIGKPVAVVIERDGVEQAISVTPVEREKREPREYEIKQWGITVRDISTVMAKEMKLESADGVLVTSVRPGGPAGDAKPAIDHGDVLNAVNGAAVKNVAGLREVTEKVTEGQSDPVPVLASFHRRAGGDFVTAVEVGLKELQDPGLEVKKAWLPAKTQVITRDLAEVMGDEELSGFRVTHVYKGTTADKAGLEVGDLILAVDGQKLTATAPEHYEELPTMIRQYRVGTEAELSIRRKDAEKKLTIELIRAPKLPREMKKYRDDDFEFTVRDITFFDKADEQWEDEQSGVLVEQVKSGGWAALGGLNVTDLIQSIDGKPVASVTDVRDVMERVAKEEPEAVVFKVLSGIYTLFIELEPKWETS